MSPEDREAYGEILMWLFLALVALACLTAFLWSLEPLP